MKKTKQKLPKVGDFFSLTTHPKMLGVRTINVEIGPSGDRDYLFNFVYVDPASKKRERQDNQRFGAYYSDGTDDIILVDPKDVYKYLL